MNESLALASVVLRVARLRTLDDVARLRQQIEAERDYWQEIIRTRTAQLEAIDLMQPVAGREPA